MKCVLLLFLFETFFYIYYFFKMKIAFFKYNIFLMIFPGRCQEHWMCKGNFLLIYICNFHVLSDLLLIYICKLHWNRHLGVRRSCSQRPGPVTQTAWYVASLIRMGGLLFTMQVVHLLMNYIWHFHVLNDLLLIYICKLHWNHSGVVGGSPGLSSSRPWRMSNRSPTSIQTWLCLTQHSP